MINSQFLVTSQKYAKDKLTLKEEIQETGRKEQKRKGERKKSNCSKKEDEK